MSLGDLFSGHLLRNCIARLDVEVAVRGGDLCGREAEPHVGGDPVLWDAEAVRIREPEADLRGRVPLVGGEPVPPHGLRIILRDALSIAILDPKNVLRLGEPLVSSTAV